MNGLIAFGIFLTIVLVLEGAYYAYRVFSRAGRSAERIRERLQEWPRPDQPKPVEIRRKEVLSDIPWLNAWATKRRWQLGWLTRWHAQAAPRMALRTYLLLSAGLASVGFLLPGLWSAPLGLLLAGGVTGAALPFVWLYSQKQRRMAAFERQLPDALDLIARALRSGHAFFVGLKLVGEEFTDPIGSEFKRAFDEVSMGISVPEALENLAKRVDCPDLRFFVTAVSVQRETGGNLAEVIEVLSGLIRKRFALYEKIRALSAEGRLSAYILFTLPLFVGTVLHVINPDYMRVLFTDPVGLNMLIAGLVMMTFGILVTKKLIVIKV